MSNNNFPQYHSVASSRWTLTMNCPDGTDETEFMRENEQLTKLEKLCNAGAVAYACVQYERGSETNRLHGQGFLVLKETHTKKWLIRRLSKNTSFKHRKAERSDDENGRHYCWDDQKEGFVRYAYEFGTWPESLADCKVQQRNPSTRDEVAKLIQHGATYAEIQDMYPGYALEKEHMIKRKITQVAALDVMRDYKRRRQDLAPYVPMVWQHWAGRWLEESLPDDRTILTICDVRGHSGKNRFIQEYTDAHPEGTVQTISAGKESNLNLVFSPATRVLFLNITRSKSEHTKHLYAFCENVKDGSVFSEKYGSEMKHFAPPKIIVFQNDPIDYGDKGGIYPGRKVADLPFHPDFTRRYVNGVDMGIEGIYEPAGRSAPWTYDRYMWWDLNDELREPFDPHEHSEFPPFNRLDENYEMYPFTPPEFGPAYSSDNAGDGPGQDGEIAPTRPAYWPIARDRFVRLEGQTAWWCMRSGRYFELPEPNEEIYVYWRYSRNPSAPWFEFCIKTNNYGGLVKVPRKNIGAQGWFPHFPPTFMEERRRMYDRRDHNARRLERSTSA